MLEDDFKLSPRVVRSLQGLVDGNLAVDQQQAIMRMLEDDKRLQQTLIELIQLEESLLYYAAAGVLGATSVSQADLVGAGFAESTGLSDSRKDWFSANDLPVLRSASRDQTGSQRGRLVPRWSWLRKHRSVLSLAAAACLAFVAGVYLTVGTRQSQLADSAPGPAIDRLAPPKTNRNTPLGAMMRSGRKGLAAITGLSPEASSSGLVSPLSVGDELRCGEVVQLEKGFMRFGFKEGSEVIVEAPAEFSVIDRDAFFARHGKYSLHGAGRLFAHTTNLTFDGRDTTAVLDVKEEEAETSVYLQKGKMAWKENPAVRDGKIALHELTEGNGVRIHFDGSERPRVSELTEPVVAVANWKSIEGAYSEYEKAVLRDDPLAYWPLARVTRNSRVLDITQNGFDGRAIGPWPPWQRDEWPPDSVATFDGVRYIEIADRPPIDRRAGFTVEAWAKPWGVTGHGAIFTSRWTVQSRTPQEQCLGFVLYFSQDGHWQFWTGSGRYGMSWRRVQADVRTPLDEWAHVVATFDDPEEVDGLVLRGMVSIFINGEKVASKPREIAIHEFAWPARIGASEDVPKAPTAWMFKGQIRDVAVYNYPLSAARIRSHYELRPMNAPLGVLRTDGLNRSLASRTK